MPELPDLQVFSRNLQKELAGKKLKKISVLNNSKLNTSEANLKKSLEGSTLKKIYREGKELHFEFSNGAVLGLHLMLHGKLFLFTEENQQKNTIIELLFEDGSGLTLTDYQHAAVPTLNPEIKNAPDALSNKVDYGFLKQLLSKKRTNVKNFLMDQKNIRGIGNAYADEILWDARIHPQSVCNKIPDQKIEALAHSIKSVLKDAEAQILQASPNIISGEVRDFLKVHHAQKKKTPGGRLIHSTTLNSRITYYTDEQVLFE